MVKELQAKDETMKLPKGPGGKGKEKPVEKRSAGFTFPRLFKRRIAPILQVSEIECGLTCLAMILSYYGRKTTLTELRSRMGVGRDGLSALTIVKAARHYDLRVRAVSLQKNDLRAVSLPAIVHWEFNHFLIVERWTKKYVEVVDPARGRQRLSMEEFDQGFTGVVIMLEPKANFDRQGQAPP